MFKYVILYLFWDYFEKNVENFVGQIFVFYDSRLIPYHAVKFYGAKLGLSNGPYIPPPSSHIYDP